MKAILAAPLLLTIASFILALLSLFAGYKPGFMEDYYLMTFNTSALGQEAIRNATTGTGTISSGATPTDPLGAIIASATAALPPAEASAIAGLIGSVGAEVADELADALGISEFYSVHAMDFCQGQFSPRATLPGAGHNVTACSTPLDFQAYNFTNKINQQLSVGPFHFTLSQLGISDDVQSKLNDIPKLARALAAVYLAAVVSSGLAMLTTTAAFFLQGRDPASPSSRTVPFSNWLISLLAVVFLLAAALVATVGARLAGDKIRDEGGEEIGLEVVLNNKLAAISWAAVGLQALAMVFWFGEVVVSCVRRRRVGGFKGEKGADGPYHGK